VNRLAPALIFCVLLIPSGVSGQNCCAPAVPQQGVLGETVALPDVLEVGLHYEYLRSRGMHQGSEKVGVINSAEADWQRTSLTLSYGIIPRLSVSAIVPVTWKNKTILYDGAEVDKINTFGFGDLTLALRFGLIPRSFVTYRELAAGIGVKIPTGLTQRYDENLLLPAELWPGTGSWDCNFSVSFYQGLELVDFTVSGTYVLTTAYEAEDKYGYRIGYKFGNQFYYLVTANFHVREGLDLSTGLTGAVRENDEEYNEEQDAWDELTTTSRHQLWLSLGIQYQLLAEKLRLHLNLEKPVYQYFDGTQLGSDYNLRFSCLWSIPLKKEQ
jgi:hypothetical protein